MRERSIVTPFWMLEDPPQGVWPPPRTAKWHPFVVARVLTAMEISFALIGWTIQDGDNWARFDQYEATDV